MLMESLCWTFRNGCYDEEVKEVCFLLMIENEHKYLWIINKWYYLNEFSTILLNFYIVFWFLIWLFQISNNV